MSSEAVHCAATGSVRFAIYPDGDDGARIIARVTREALCELFGAAPHGDVMVHAYTRHADLIDACALMRYRLDPSRAVVLVASDFAASCYCPLPEQVQLAA